MYICILPINRPSGRYVPTDFGWRLRMIGPNHVETHAHPCQWLLLNPSHAAQSLLVIGNTRNRVFHKESIERFPPPYMWRSIGFRKLN